MSRYIDVDELKENICKRVNNPAIRGWLNRLIDDTPTADVVPVVRCKDCKYYVDQYCTRDIKCRTNMFYMCADDFCSYGKRRVNDG